MKITYIKHSGILVELENDYLLFDYYEGQIPRLEPKKKLTVFVSHAHYDHFNEEIFTLFKEHPNVCFVVSSDVKTSNHIDLIVEPNVEVDFNGMIIKTLKSTDIGVAYVVEIDGMTIYHAGDLNLWHFEDDTLEEHNQMQNKFSREIDKLAKVSIDVAFLPLDPRQGKMAFGGIEEFVEKTNVRWIIPMHTWDKYSIIQEYNACHEKQLIEVVHENQSFVLTK